LQLREQVSQLVQDAHAVLRPAHTLDLGEVVRTFTLRTSEEFVERFGPALLARIAQEAPGVRLRFVHKSDKHSALLRDGGVDLETGVVDVCASPEVLTQALFRDRLVGVVREGHALSRGPLSAARFAQGQHVYVSRRGQDRGQIDEALEAQGLVRQVSIVVAGFNTAIALARDTDLIASVPERYITVPPRGLYCFELPVTLPPFTVAMLWHPRQDADLAHRWLRACLREVCGP